MGCTFVMSKRIILNYPSRLTTCWYKPMCYFATKTLTWNSIIKGHVKNGEIYKARKVFDEMPERNKDIVTWNLMISGYVSRCVSRMRNIELGRYLFDQMPCRDLVSWNTMISGYARVGRMDDAFQLFRSMPERDLVSWNTMIGGCARVGRMDDAFLLFRSMPEQDVITWNAMVTGFLHNCDVDRAIEWFRRMPERDVSSLSAFVLGLIRINECDKAKEILLECKERVDGRKEGLVLAYNTLIARYGQRGRVDEARSLFDQMPCNALGGVRENLGFERNLVTWNSMIMSYVKVGDVKSARELFDEMVVRDLFSWNTIINGYAQASDMEQAARLFSQMPNPDIMSWNIMVSGYAQSGNLQSALDFFYRAPQRNLISWNSVIAGCDKNGDYMTAIKLFIQMRTEEVKPDKHTLSSILSVCTGIAALELGRQIHQLITKTLIADIPINNSLVTMYSRCGTIAEARIMFDEMGLLKDVISWNAIIGGYASHGYAAMALELFEEMKRLKVRPTVITFVSVLNACAHAGLLNEGRKYFESMLLDFGIEPRLEHYAALVNIMGRHGHLHEAMDLINNMPHKPDITVWGALLDACRIYNNVELARVASEAMSKLEPQSSAPYILLRNMFIDVEQWEVAKGVKNTMEMNDIRKSRASSWLDCAASGGYC